MIDSFFLTHYYLPDRKPFLNLSALEDEELNLVLAGLREKNKRGESKRVFMDWYVADRKRCEDRLKKMFLAKGGNPRKNYPHYFVLGQSSILKSLANDTRELNFALGDFPEDQISFTYPDSMASFDLENDEKFKMPYHGKVFTLSEIINLIQEYGFPADETGYTSRYGYPKYIEAQVWSDQPLADFLKR